MLELWNKWEKTPTNLIKTDKTEDGTEIKTVSSIHRFKKATEILGVYGKTWGLKNIKHFKFQIGNLVIAELEAIFFVKTNEIETEFEISNSTSITNRGADGKISFNAQYRKALETDTCNKALSKLGLFADIYADEELTSQVDGADELENVDFIDFGAKDE